MTSFSPVRNPEADHLITPQNAALVVIDYQPVQVSSIASMPRQAMVANVISTIKAAKLFGVPIILSTVNVATGMNQPTIHQIADLLPDVTPIDRTGLNAWEDMEFVDAIKALDRRKLVVVALWTEACLAFMALDAVRDGHEVYAVIDAVGGTSEAAHDFAIKRMIQAGVIPTTWAQFVCELQRDWIRTDTIEEAANLLHAVAGL